MTITAALLVTTALIGLAAVRPARAVEVAAAAPLFAADSSAGPIRLADYQGKKNVLVAFYFADFTGG
jgi:peroxiredoxin Q/BCP